jgi:hypothetical protein
VGPGQGEIRGDQVKSAFNQLAITRDGSGMRSIVLIGERHKGGRIDEGDLLAWRSPRVIGAPPIPHHFFGSLG